MKLFRFLPILLLVAVTGISCVSKKKFQELQGNYTKLDNENKDLNTKYQTSEKNLAVTSNQVTTLNEQLTAERSNSAALQAALSKCLTSTNQGNVNISKLVDEINKSNAYIQQLINAKNKNDSLNLVLSSNLARSLTPDETKDVNIQVLK